MNDDVVAKLNTIPADTYLRISHRHSDGTLASMAQGWLKNVDFDAKTLTLESANYQGQLSTVWIDNIKSASDIDDTTTGSGSPGPAVSGGKHYVRGQGWVAN
ncbi:hypothetical protein V9K90_11560 [Pseudomonas sp. CCNWLW56]|uniref:hypothetical protein n=1 Tax=Pseudomonas TaxID=286 RepID=UPI00115FD86B|nr:MULTISPECIES: hypothetical protein [Pseudomonas]MDT8907787.1 hypothetical protein [Pseudomonas prosekii]NHN70472.1 hypothetical protein [Pseudomonas fluorescens]